MTAKTFLVLGVGVVLQLGVCPKVAPAQSLDSLLGGVLSSMGSGQDDSIKEAFSDVLGRKPNERETRRYRSLMEEENWTAADIREDLRQRDDYRRHSLRTGHCDPEIIVRRSYQDVLGREPDQEGMRLYRSRVIDDDWSEQEIRDDLRKSPERAKLNGRWVEKVIRRAYEDILNREADVDGLATYRSKMMNDGWDEQDVRSALKKSRENRDRGAARHRVPGVERGERQKGSMAREQAQQMVRRAYREVLGRDPDGGSSVYIDKILYNRWNEGDVAKELRRSPEYKKRQGKS